MLPIQHTMFKLVRRSCSTILTVGNDREAMKSLVTDGIVPTILPPRIVHSFSLKNGVECAATSGDRTVSRDATPHAETAHNTRKRCIFWRGNGVLRT